MQDSLEKQHGFLIIDHSSKKHNSKYRSRLNEIYPYQIKLKIKTIIIIIIIIIIM